MGQEGALAPALASKHPARPVSSQIQPGWTEAATTSAQISPARATVPAKHRALSRESVTAPTIFKVKKNPTIQISATENHPRALLHA